MNKLLVMLLGLTLVTPLLAPPRRIGRTPVMRTGLNRKGADLGKFSRGGRNIDRKKLEERIKKKQALAKQRREEMSGNTRASVRSKNNSESGTRSEPAVIRSGKVEVQYDPSKSVSTKTDDGEVITIPILTHFKKLSKSAKVHLDFYNTELTHIIKFISDRTGTNFIVSGNLKNKKITMFCPKQVRAIDALNAFFTVLSIHNLSVIRSGAFYRIVNATDANKPYNLYYQNDRVPNVDYYVTKIYQLKYVSTDDVERLINRLKSRSGVVVSYKPTNLLIFTDQGRLVNKIFKIIRQVDIPTDTATDKIWIVPIYYGEAKDIASKLEEIFDLKSKRSSRNSSRNSSRRHSTRNSTKGKKKTSPAASKAEEPLEIERIIADERSSQLIIVSNESSKLKVVDLIKKLDIPLEDDSSVHVYYLKNAKAEDIARTINSLASGSSSSSRRSSRGRSAAPVKGVMFQGEVKVTADKTTNTLVVVASGRDYNNLRKVIEKLDLKRRQVYVEAVIMELSMDKTRDMGVSISGGAEKQIAGETVPMYGGSNYTNLSTVNISPTSLTGFAFGALGPSIDLTDDISIPSFGVILKALQTNKNANILSSPHVLTMDNEEAEFLVGENVPFPGAMASAASSALSYAAATISIQRQDVALKLSITPQISEDGEVKLEMKLEITDVKSTDSTLGPTTSKRSVKTTVVVPDQQTIVIGGLTKDSTKDTEYKVPILGDIPVLGHFFKTSTKSIEKSNLMVFLTPYIVHNSSDMDAIWKKKRAEFEEFRRLKSRADKGFDIFIDYKKKRGIFSEINKEVKAFKKKVELDKKMNEDTSELRYDEDLKTQQERFKKQMDAQEAKEQAERAKELQ